MWKFVLHMLWDPGTIWKTYLFIFSTILEVVNFWFVYIFPKRHAPRHDAEWSNLRTEICHMRPIQGQTLKLFKVLIYERLEQCHVVLPQFALMYVNRIQKTNDISEWGAQTQSPPLNSQIQTGLTRLIFTFWTVHHWSLRWNEAWSSKIIFAVALVAAEKCALAAGW